MTTGNMQTSLFDTSKYRRRLVGRFASLQQVQEAANNANRFEKQNEQLVKENAAYFRMIKAQAIHIRCLIEEIEMLKRNVQ
ncbi:MAG: hypothetical protein Q8861_02150 [Bacteroidota bacterium]|nr:hypothetical protein [Bacteroidota bacterium]